MLSFLRLLFPNDETYILDGKKSFMEFWEYCKPLISNISNLLYDPNRFKGLDGFIELNRQCHENFGYTLREVLTFYFGLLDRKSTEFAPGHFDTLDGQCVTLGYANKIVFFPEHKELQINVISLTTQKSPLMIQLVQDSPLVKVYYSEYGVEKSFAIAGINN